MSPRAPLAAALLATALLAPAASVAAESPLVGSFELTAGPYRPNIDKGPGITASPGPYETIFGTSEPWAIRLLGARALPWRDYGTMEIGLGVGYWAKTGHAVDDTGAPTGDRTSLKIVPLEATFTWRGDFIYRRFKVPVVPFGRVGLEMDNWWITGTSGKTSKSGATNGWFYGGGLGLVLDVLDPGMAREQDADFGVNHTLLTFEVRKAKVDDFGSKSSFDLSPAGTAWTVGLLFVF